MAEIATIDKVQANKVGRPCKYESHVEPYLDDVYEWLKQGYTDYSIAEQLGIAKCSLIKYKEEYVELSDLYTRALHERNCLVMNKMFQRATGEKVALLKQKATKDGEILDLVEEQYIPPDVNAADLFLRNNDETYKGPKSVEITNNTTNNFQLPEKLKEIEQLDKAITDLEKQLAVDVEAIPID